MELDKWKIKRIMIFVYIDFFLNFFYLYYNYFYTICIILNMMTTIYGAYSYKKFNVNNIFLFSFLRIMKNFSNFIYLVYHYSNYKYDNIIYFINSLIFLCELIPHYFVYKFNEILVKTNDNELEIIKNNLNKKKLELTSINI